MRRLALAALTALLGCARPSTSSPLEQPPGQRQPLPPGATVDATAGEDPDGTSTGARASPGEPADPAADGEPPSLLAPVTAADEALCVHITGVVASGLTNEQFDELVASCSIAIAQRRRALGEDEFARRASCTLAATTAEQLSACKHD